MKTLAQRYAYATRIPESCFTVTQYGDYIHVNGNTFGLPASFCTVSQICVADGKFLDIFTEADLGNAEFVQSEHARNSAKYSTPKPCHCHSN